MISIVAFHFNHLKDNWRFELMFIDDGDHFRSMTWIATEQVLRERGLGEQIKDVRYEIEPHDDYKVWVARPSERARVFSIDPARVLVAGGHTAEVIKPFVHEALGKLYPQSQN